MGAAATDRGCDFSKMGDTASSFCSFRNVSIHARGNEGMRFTAFFFLSLLADAARLGLRLRATSGPNAARARRLLCAGVLGETRV
jgi:hypothetical protein